MILPIVLFSTLLLLSGLFSSLETAFTSLTPYDVEDLFQKNRRRGRIVKRLSNHSDILLTTLLIGNNLVNIGASALATTMTIELFGSQFVGIMTGGLTLVVLIFCEVTPKQIALANNKRLASSLAIVVLILSWIFRPFIWIITAVSNLLTSLFTDEDRSHFTLNNLLHMVKMGENLGIVKTYEKQMVKNVFRIDDTPVQAIMTHRTETFCLDREVNSEDVYRDIIEQRIRRIPLYKDEPENIVGILLVKNFLKERLDRPEGFSLKELEEKPLIIPRSCKVNQLFSLFKKENLNIAVVLDEYGGLDGVVTIHDVVQEIFGDLDDEGEERDPEKIIQSKNGWVIQGDADFYDIKDALGIELVHNKGILTIGGYLLEKLGHIPDKGEAIKLPEGTFVIQDIQNNRIESIFFNKNDSEHCETL
ncbi:MAG: hemolysin family protein [Spirochaetaceae bacterium]|jgi:putative hemolysin|nr:hemolysin family protein [Spirochaetaceae bacterium]